MFRSIFDTSNFQSALVQFAYYGTGVRLITGDAVDGVPSEGRAFGVRNRWG